MKRKLFTLTVALMTSVCAFAQLPAGSLAPDFTLKDLNGNSYNLYSLLNQGKTVFIDVSAAWCGPCWSYHNSGALENLYKQHGPAGAPNVNANTTDNVMVLFIEGESTNTTAQLYGTSTGSSYANNSQGNWVAGTPYPIIDTNAAATSAFNTAWNIGYFPTIYMVCRDHLVQEVGQLTTAELYAKAQQICPAYAPSATYDAKVVPYTGKDYFFCNANPAVKFQNYSQTSNITRAAINVYSGSSLITTFNWAGNVAPYGIASITIPAFPATAFAPYKYEVVVTGDSQPTNNISADSLFKVYVAANAGSIPYKETFEGVTELPYRYASDGGVGFLYNNSGGVYQVTGVDGAQTSAIAVDFYDLEPRATTEFVFGNFNTQSAPNVALDFDLAYSPYTAASPENDKLEVLVSTDCGTNWTSVWSKSDTVLQTRTANGSAFFPSDASQWRHESVLLTPYKSSNMIVKLKGTSDYGNFCWLDNMKLTPTLAVANVITAGSVSIYPNPARTSATLDFTLSKSGQVSVNVLDAVGRTVAVAADAVMQQGAQHISIATASLAAGVYNIAIRTEEGTLTQRLTVVK